MDNLSPLLAASGIIGLFGAAATLVIQLFRQNSALATERRGEINDLKNDVKELKAENYTCKMQLNGVVEILRRSGTEVPEWLYRKNGD